MSIKAGTTNEVANSLTGWEELAIKRAFGLSVGVMANPEDERGDQLLMIRALGAVVLARRGQPDADPEGPGESIRNPLEPGSFVKLYHQVMGMQEIEVEALFDKDDEPSDEGKGESLTPATPPTTSPTSSLQPASSPASTTA